MQFTRTPRAQAEKVVGLGAGGHARVIVEILLARPDLEIVGLLDADPKLWGTTQLGVPVLGSDDVLPKLVESGVRNAFIGVGTLGESDVRKNLYIKVRQLGLQLISCIHPSAVISPSAEVGDGATIMARAVVNTGVRTGANVIVNTGAIVDHDCTLEHHTHVAPGAQLGSAVMVGEGAHIGIGATVRQCLRIGRYAVVGAGAVVVRDVPDYTVVVGVPARPIRRARA